MITVANKERDRTNAGYSENPGEANGRRIRKVSSEIWVVASWMQLRSSLIRRNTVLDVRRSTATSLELKEKLHEINELSRKEFDILKQKAFAEKWKIFFWNVYSNRRGEGLFENRRQEQREFSYFNLTSVFGVGKLERASERSTEPEINMTVSFRLVVPANARTHIAHAVTLRPGYSL